MVKINLLSTIPKTIDEQTNEQRPHPALAEL